MIKKIESEKEDVTDVSENLTRKNAQVESIQRLVAMLKKELMLKKKHLSKLNKK